MFVIWRGIEAEKLRILTFYFFGFKRQLHKFSQGLWKGILKPEVQTGNLDTSEVMSTPFNHIFTLNLTKQLTVKLGDFLHDSNLPLISKNFIETHVTKDKEKVVAVLKKWSHEFKYFLFSLGTYSEMTTEKKLKKAYSFLFNSIWNNDKENNSIWNFQKNGFTSKWIQYMLFNLNFKKPIQPPT